MEARASISVVKSAGHVSGCEPSDKSGLGSVEIEWDGDYSPMVFSVESTADRLNHLGWNVVCGSKRSRETSWIGRRFLLDLLEGSADWDWACPIPKQLASPPRIGTGMCRARMRLEDRPL